MFMLGWSKSLSLKSPSIIVGMFVVEACVKIVDNIRISAW